MGVWGSIGEVQVDSPDEVRRPSSPGLEIVSLFFYNECTAAVVQQQLLSSTYIRPVLGVVLLCPKIDFRSFSFRKEEGAGLQAHVVVANGHDAFRRRKSFGSTYSSARC